MTKHTETTTDAQERQEWLMDALQEVHYRWNMFRQVSDPVVQAHQIVKLNDAIFDLSTYHPSYDYESGTLGWERIDDA